MPVQHTSHRKPQLSPSARAVRTALALPAVSLVFATSAWAQQQAFLEEVIVTATRRAGSAQDLPINIAALGGDQIQELGFADVTELLAYVPGINGVNQGGRNGNQTIVRGLNAEPLGQGENDDTGGTVATYIGEVPFLLDFRLQDLDRVEVLLGPQGTLYGAGTLGGAIRYIPNKPDASGHSFEFRGDTFSIDQGDGLSTDVGVTFNFALSETFAIRGSVDKLNNEGWVDYPYVVREIGVSEPDADRTDPAAVAANFAPVEDANEQEILSGRLAARWTPTDNIDATLTYYFQDEENGGRTTSSARGAFPTNRYESASRVLEPNDEENDIFTLEIIADLGFAELTSATGMGEFTEQGQRDQTDLLISLEYSYELFPTFTAFTAEDQFRDFVSQELRLVSTGDSRINWIVGAYYNNLETANISSEFTPGYAAFAGFNRPDDLEYFSTESEEITESAIYGEIGFDLTDRWTLTLGARFYEYEIQGATSVDFPLFDPGFVAETNLDAIFARPFDPLLFQEDDDVLFKINASYQMSDDITLYATISEGFRIGGGNGGGPCPAFDPNAAQGNCNLAPGQQFGPGPNDFAQFDERSYTADLTRNYEFGAKTRWLNGALTFNSALFYVDWEDPQLSSATVNASIPITINATGAESQGVEMSLDWLATSQLRLRGTYSYTQSELSADVPSLIRTIVTTGGFGTAFEDGIAGDQLPGSPESQFSLFASYSWDLANGRELRFNGGYSWQDDVLSRTGARGGSLTLDSYGIANLSVAYIADTWSVTGYINNAFDEFAEAGVQSDLRNNQIVNGASVRSLMTQVLAPRTVGARFRYRF